MSFTCVFHFSAKDIKHLEIIEEPSKANENVSEEDEEPSRNVVVIKKPVAKRPGRSVSESAATGSALPVSHTSYVPQPQPYLNSQEYSRHYDIGDGNRSPNKRDRLKQRWQERDEACFGSPIDDEFNEDFDFEKNLALFNKQV